MSALASEWDHLGAVVVALVQDRFERAPHMLLRIKAYVYDHRFEPRMQGDITSLAKAEFPRRGLLARWPAASRTSAPAVPAID